MTTRLRRALARLLLATIAALAGIVVVAGPASAHAAILQTVPFDTERVEPGEAPDAVTITFNEAINSPPGGIRVFDEAGTRVDIDGPVPAADDDAAVVGRAVGDLDDGAYIVTWRVVSADGHPLKGAYVFTVGEADAASDTLVASLFGGDDGLIGPVQRLLASVSYAAVLLVAGALLAAAALGTAAAERSASLVRSAAIVGVIASVAAVPLQAMAVSGDGLAAFSGSQLASVLGGSVGIAAVVRFVGLAGTLILTGRARMAASLVALGSFLLDGHTRTVEPAWLLFSADAVHLVAGAVWFGGLVVLVRELRGRRLAADPVGGATMLAAWSGLATWTVVAVTLAGSALTFATVRQPIALFTTTYGQLLQIKVLLALIAIAIGAYNHFGLVRRVERAAVPVPAGGSDDGPTAGAPAAGTMTEGEVTSGLAWLRLRRTVRAEVLLLLGVLVVTGVLQNQRPASEAVGIGGIFQATEAITDDLTVDLVVDPNIAGENSIHVYLFDATGRPFPGAESISLSMSLPEQEIGPIEREPVVSGPGHWVQVGRELALPGTWDVTLVVRIDRFTEASLTVPVVVAAP